MKAPRMTSWWLISAALLVVVMLVSPQQVPVVVYKASLLALAAATAYAVDRALFPYGRPHEHFKDGHHLIGTLLMLRRAIVVAAAMVAMGLAL